LAKRIRKSGIFTAIKMQRPEALFPTQPAFINQVFRRKL